MNRPPRDFQKDLAYSQQATDEPFWNAIYQKAFPTMVGQITNPKDNAAQRMGIDRVILLANGRVLKIDEKKREQTYDDILLEYISNDRTGAPGWMEKDLAIDYLAYAFMPTQEVYLFDWLMLRRAWLHYKPMWLSTCKKRSSQNPGYKTWGVCVPIDTLQRAVWTASHIQLNSGIQRKAA